MNAEETTLTDSYLAQLQEEARQLPADQAAEMVADIREHLSAATAGDASEAHTREVLDRLGSPQALVAEALGEAGNAPAAPTPPPASQSPYADILAAARRRATPSTTWSGRETTAIACLIGAEVGIILFPLAAGAWLVGLISLATSRTWTSREKTLGGLTLGLGFPLAAIAAIVAVISAQWSLFNLGVHRICDFGNPSSFNSAGTFGLGEPTQISLCRTSGSSSHTVLTALAIVGAILLVAQIVAVWKLLQARHRTPAV